MDNLLTIKQLKNKNELPWKLLLLADPSKKTVERYIDGSDAYIALINNVVIGVYVLTIRTKGVIELKNIAVDENHQGQGIGKRLVLDAIKRAKNKKAKKIEVGTGNSSLSQLALYQKCGFRIVGVEKGFFTKNYTEKIIENGIECVDMIRLEMEL